MTTVLRYTPNTPCPVCGGNERLPRGHGQRCAGFLSGDYAHCTREERSRGLPLDEKTNPPSYLHWLGGPCRCGEDHDSTAVPSNGRRALGATGREVAPYDYRDEAGALLYQNVRLHPKDFRQRRPDGTWKTAGVRRVPYRLPELLAADPAAVVFVCEGEKDCDRLRSLGLAATSSPEPGQGGRGWKPQTAEALRGRPVVVLVDNDNAGRAGAAKAAAVFQDVGAATVHTLELPGLPPGGDVSDWLDAGHTVEELRQLVEEAEMHSAADPGGSGRMNPGSDADSAGDSAALRDGAPAERITERSGPAWRTAAELAASAPERVPWVIEPYVASTSITELDGLPKVAGKTTLTLHMVTAVLDGRDFLGSPTRRGSVVLLTEERDATLRPALRRAGVLQRSDLHILRRIDVRGLSWERVCHAAAEKCANVSAVLMVVDTLSKWAGLDGDKENDAGHAAKAMEPLQAIAASGMAILVLRHERKSGGDVGQSGRGSNAWTGDADVVLSLRRLEGNSLVTGNARRLEAVGRFDETPDSLVIELTDGGYVAHGDDAAIERRRAELAILSALPEEDHAVTMDELIQRAKVRRTMAQAVMGDLGVEGKVVRVGEGKKGDPHRYHRPDKRQAPSSTATPASPPSTQPEVRANGAQEEVPVDLLGRMEAPPQGGKIPDEQLLTCEHHGQTIHAWRVIGGVRRMSCVQCHP